MSLALRVIIAVLLNAAAAIWAYRRGSVSTSGAIAGFVTGSGIFAAAGPFGWGLLMLFFLSSTALGKLAAGRKRHLSEMHSKSDRRDAEQVLANSGIGFVTSILYGVTSWPGFLLAAAVSFAAANADTWASEIGVLSRRQPRSIRTGMPVPAGASGGVTPLGFLASAGGAAFIGLYFALLAPVRGALPFGPLWLVGIMTAGGLLGSIIDSVLGATVQAQYTDAATGRYTERPAGVAGANSLTGGFVRITNDTVNFLSCAGATAASIVTAVAVV
ncbi:MAG: DUF92 domain-containing protein [bacterium]